MMYIMYLDKNFMFAVTKNSQNFVLSLKLFFSVLAYFFCHKFQLVEETDDDGLNRYNLVAKDIMKQAIKGLHHLHQNKIG